MPAACDLSGSDWPDWQVSSETQARDRRTKEGCHRLDWRKLERKRSTVKRRLFLAGIVAVTFFVATLLNAQTPPPKKKGATITGTVIGPDDKPVRKASVMCQSSAGSSPHATYTDSKGHFMITGLKMDSYDVRASSNGVFSEWEKNIPLCKGQTKDLTLHLIYAKEMPKAAGPKQK
jgi:hypothetical protein